MNVVRVGPVLWSVKERIDLVVRVGYMSVAKVAEGGQIWLHWMQLSYRDLDIDNGLGAEARYRRGTNMIDPAGELAEGLTNTRRLDLE